MAIREKLPAERQVAILDRLRRDGRVLAGDLALEFQTSEDTIRRVLRDLAAQGHCKRVYGGALAVSPASGSAVERRAEATERKLALGAALAGIVRRKQLVFIDAGSTNLAAARFLAADLDITVATHDPAIAALLAPRTDLTLLMIGGRVDAHVGAAVNGQALRQVLELRPDLLLLGVCALDADAGIAAFNSDDADMKRALLQVSSHVAAAALSDKLGVSAPFRVSEIQGISELVVEADASERLTKPFAECGLRLTRANKNN